MPKIVFLVPEGNLLLVVWSSVGLWVRLVCGSKVFTLRWVGFGWVSCLVGWVGWVEEIGPMDNSGLIDEILSQTKYSLSCF